MLLPILSLAWKDAMIILTRSGELGQQSTESLSRYPGSPESAMMNPCREHCERSMKTVHFPPGVRRTAPLTYTRNVSDFAGCGVDLLNPWER
jgi:hypothetical protein